MTVAPVSVSVIVPNYNHAAYLRQRLDSIFHQSFQDFEVILLDDCSTDNSVDILQQYADQYRDKVAHFIVNNQNSGNPFLQWKKGIELAQGELIWIAESDDFCEVNLLEILVKNIKKNKQVNVAAANLIQVDAFGKHLSNRTKYTDVILTGEKALTKHFTAGTYLWNASAVLFRKSAVQNVDWKRITNMKFCGDWFFWSMLLEKGSLATTGPYLSYFRVHHRSVSSQSISQYCTFTEGLDIVQWIINRYTLSSSDRMSACYAWLKKLNESEIDYNSKRVFEAEIKKIFPVSYPILLKYALQFRQIKSFLLNKNSFVKLRKQPFPVGNAELIKH